VRLSGGYRIIQDPVPFGAKRKRQTAAYSLRHYGQYTWHLHPQVIVLHWTDGSSYEGAHRLFALDAPDLGELPGDVAHFIIAQNGRIYQQLSTEIRGRHAIGLNWVAIGIEFVQVQGRSSHWADLQILHRTQQIDAGLALVDYLCQRYHIKVKNIIGHAMANDSPFFKDLEGWKNDHTDWQRQDVLRFRRMLGAWERSHP
jgi:N-acetyl-anhydromuramyl-L-alanine amidase AmpD